MGVSEVVSIVLGGSLVSALGVIVTLRSTARKAKAEALRMEADAERVRLDNSEHATRILLDNLMKPLIEKLNETKTELDLTKRELARNTREMARFRKALERVSDCDYRDQCPVLDELRKQPKGHGAGDGATERTGDTVCHGQKKDRDAGYGKRGCADGGGVADATCGQCAGTASGGIV